MNDFIPHYSRNSNAIHESLVSYSNSTSFVPAIQHYQTGSQSASVTINGYLWQQKLVDMENVNTRVMPIDLLQEMKLRSHEEHLQKRRDIIQLLKSWREDDKQEQHETLEYLKKAIDEDRLSDRKLFG